MKLELISESRPEVPTTDRLGLGHRYEVPTTDRLGLGHRYEVPARVKTV